ncbi:MAG: DUF4358 domain-containing protein [Clostridia bacterium]|nr:DUF4358 domain-containing protein [Clostridia bacterium]
MKKYFRLMLCALLVIAFAASAAACKGGDPKPIDTNDNTAAPATQAPAKDLDVDELAKSISENVPFEDEYLTLVEDREFALKFYKIDPALVAEKDGVKQVAVYSASSTPEMIVCVKAVDEASAEQVLEPIKALLKYYAENYTNYGPEQVQKINSAVEVIDGCYVIVAVSNDNTAAGKYIDGLLGK